jgi:AraC-like DNA-binding protein
MPLQLLDIILLVFSGIGLAFFIGLLFLYKRKQSNLYLGLLFGTLFFVLFKGIIHAGEYYTNYSVLLFIPIYWTTAIGVFTFLYVKEITLGFQFKLKHTLHFLPLLIQVCFHSYWFVKPYHIKRTFYENEYFSGILFYEEWIAAFLAIAYTTLSLRIIKRFITKHHKVLDEKHLQSLFWSKKLSVVQLVYTGLWIAYLAIDTFASNFTLPYAYYYPLYVATITFIGWIGLSVLLIPTIINSPTKLTVNNELFNNVNLKQTIEVTLIPNIFDINYTLLTTEQFAEKMGVNAKYLSDYFNIHFNSTYNDYIIAQRMKQFEALTQTFDASKGDVIKQLQYGCGYLSKATFNRHVKFHFGDTPSNLVKLSVVSNA